MTLVSTIFFNLTFSLNVNQLTQLYEKGRAADKLTENTADTTRLGKSVVAEWDVFAVMMNNLPS